MPKQYEGIDKLEYQLYDKKHDDIYLDNFKIIVYNMDNIKKGVLQ